MDNDRPYLPIELQLKIELSQADVHKKYLECLQGYVVQRTFSAPIVPPPPQPVAICHLLGEYASELFSLEAKHYPEEPRLEGWLEGLGKRTSDRVMQMVQQTESRSLFGGSLHYHATEREMTLAVSEALRLAISRRLSGLAVLPLSQKSPKPIGSEKQTGTHRLRSIIDCPSAARKLELFLSSNGIGLTDFASTAQTTDRTLRNFRRTGKIRRDIFGNIAKAMGTTKEELLKD